MKGPSDEFYVMVGSAIVVFAILAGAALMLWAIGNGHYA